jgi:hypothetical protein
MNSELVQALDRLRESVDSLRSTFEDAARPHGYPGQLYLDELREMHAKGLIDDKTLADKQEAFLDKF